jgi:hypothetical protein
VTRWPAGKTHEQQLRIFERKDNVPSLMAVANHMWGVIQGGMSKSFRDWHVDQQLLLPPAVQELCWNLGDAVIRRRSVLACW